MSESAYYYDRVANTLMPRDACGYREQTGRIADYQHERIPESVLPFARETDYPDGCQVCGRATWWESRWLPDGRWQERCSECLDTITTTT